jgi:hypothetical protein
VKRKCPVCGRLKAPKRRPAHQQVLDLMPYAEWVERFCSDGVEKCNLCGRPRMEGQNALHRDHDHKTGEPRGLLCHRCNRALPNWMTAEWLTAAIDYLRRET